MTSFMGIRSLSLKSRRFWAENLSVEKNTRTSQLFLLRLLVINRDVLEVNLD